MEHIFDDSTLSARALGVLLWCQHRERFTAKDIQDRFIEFFGDYESLLDLLTFFVATKGYFELVGDYEYVFVGAKKKEKVLTPLEQKFEDFRLEYKRTTGCAVPGFNTALKAFKARHKDWKECIPLLTPALRKEVEYRKYRASIKEFVAPWANFETWMGNQRRWEKEYDIPAQQESAWSDQRLLSEYMQELGGDKPKLLSQFEYSIWHSKIGPFMNIDRQMSPAVRRQKILHAHEAAQLTPQIVDKAGGLFQYLVAICKP